MFHVGKVKKIIVPKNKNVISSDNSVEAMVMMWDKNLLILEVDPKLSSKIKDNDFIIADYRPIAADSPHRKMKIIKILRGDLGKKIFKEFADEYEAKKSKAESAAAQAAQPAPMPYIR
jgi:hypothetical protein